MFLLQIAQPLKDTIKKILAATYADSSGHPAISIIPKNTTIDSNVLSALIGAAVALLVLVVTIFYDRLKLYLDKRDERKKRLIYYAALVKPIITYSDKQAEDIKAFAEALQKDPLVFPLLSFSPKNALAKLVHKIDEPPYFDAFTTYYIPYSESVRTFKKITGIAEYQDMQTEQVLEIVKKSQEFDHERKIKFQASFKAAMDLAATSIAQQEMQEKYAKLLDLLDHHLVDFITNRQSPADLRFAYERFIQPVTQGIVKNEFYQIPVGLAIANHLHEAAEIYSDIIMQMESIRDDFFKIAEAYAKSNENLKKESTKLLADFFDRN